jgi:hypothetical protein
VSARASGLSDAYGDTPEALYTRYERARGRARKTIKAQDFHEIWSRRLKLGRRSSFIRMQAQQEMNFRRTSAPLNRRISAPRPEHFSSVTRHRFRRSSGARSMAFCVSITRSCMRVEDSDAQPHQKNHRPQLLPVEESDAQPHTGQNGLGAGLADAFYSVADAV